mmetsp:Transcript_77885/g.216402  ORF Transcript_77885/g.216402 Transcript_77885/m.216402 type:complete len:219 (+) Transcript_77885:134-790(+)
MGCPNRIGSVHPKTNRARLWLMWRPRCRNSCDGAKRITRRSTGWGKASKNSLGAPVGQSFSKISNHRHSNRSCSRIIIPSSRRSSSPSSSRSRRSPSRSRSNTNRCTRRLMVAKLAGSTAGVTIGIGSSGMATALSTRTSGLQRAPRRRRWRQRVGLGRQLLRLRRLRQLAKVVVVALSTPILLPPRVLLMLARSNGKSLRVARRSFSSNLMPTSWRS